MALHSIYVVLRAKHCQAATQQYVRTSGSTRRYPLVAESPCSYKTLQSSIAPPLCTSCVLRKAWGESGREPRSERSGTAASERPSHSSLFVQVHRRSSHPSLHYLFFGCTTTAFPLDLRHKTDANKLKTFPLSPSDENLVCSLFFFKFLSYVRVFISFSSLRTCVRRTAVRDGCQRRLVFPRSTLASAEPRCTMPSVNFDCSLLPVQVLLSRPIFYLGRLFHSRSRYRSYTCLQ
jgi:hypothetical protein